MITFGSLSLKVPQLCRNYIFSPCDKWAKNQPDPLLVINQIQIHTNPNPTQLQNHGPKNIQAHPTLCKINKTNTPTPVFLSFFHLPHSTCNSTSPPSSSHPTLLPTLHHLFPQKHATINAVLTPFSPKTTTVPNQPTVLINTTPTWSKLHQTCPLHFQILPRSFNCIRTASIPRGVIWRQN